MSQSWRPRPLKAHALREVPPKVQKQILGYDVEKNGKEGFVRYGVHGKGTCFFHSVCAACNFDNYLGRPRKDQLAIGRKFRCDFTRQLTDEQWQKFLKKQGLPLSGGQDAAAMRRKFCESGEWADETMIRYVSDRLGLNMVFVDVDGNRMYCGVKGQPKQQPTLVVLWLARSHFEPLGLVVKPKQPGKAHVQFLFDPVKDAGIVRGVMETYGAQCRL